MNRTNFVPRMTKRRFSLSQQNRFYKKAAAFVLRAVSKHSPQLAQAVVDSGALDALVFVFVIFFFSFS